MSKRIKKVYGVGINDGINDADYSVYRYKVLNGKKIKEWSCPFYKRWHTMLQRCYTSKYQERKPTYRGCTVCEDWLTFSNFKSWMEEQEWEGKHLDKDFLVEGNKVYSPPTCVFIPSFINNFILDRGNGRGELPLGVCKDRGKYMSRCCDPFKTKGRHIGSFNTPEEAHKAWQLTKRERAIQLQSQQTDSRVIAGLQRIIDKLQYDYENNLETFTL